MAADVDEAVTQRLRVDRHREGKKGEIRKEELSGGVKATEHDGPSVLRSRRSRSGRREEDVTDHGGTSVFQGR